MYSITIKKNFHCLIIFGFIFLLTTLSYADTCGTIPGAVILTAPAVTTTDTTPTLRWESDTCATWYKVYLINTATDYKLVQWYEVENSTTRYPDVSCSGGTCSIPFTTPLAYGNYEWWVRTWNDSGNGPWSATGSFSVQINDTTTPNPNTAPSKIYLRSPSGSVDGSSAIFKWNQNAEATWYNLYISGSSSTYKFDQWYELKNDSAKYPEATCSGGICSVTVNETFPNDTFNWYVRGWNDVGNGDWSDSLSFTVQRNEPDPVEPDPVEPPAKVTESSPSGNIQDTSPTFVWSKVNEATWYQLLIQDSSQQNIHKKFYDSTNICSGSSCSVTPDLDLDGGSYTFWVKSWNDDGYTWSNGKSFTLPMPSELDQEIEDYMGIITSVGDLAPTIEEIGTILTEVLGDEGSSVVTITPAGVLDDPLSLLSNPQPVTISANFGNGYTPTGGTGVLTGSMVISITNISFSETGITANVSISATNVKRDGILVLKGGMSLSIVLVPGANNAISLTGNVNFSNLQSLDFQVNGGIAISAPNMSTDGQLSQPVTITFQNLATLDYQISGTATITQSSSSAYDMVLNLTTNQGNVTGKVRMNTSNPDKTVITTPSGPLQIEDATVDFNNVTLESEVCSDTPASGNIVINQGSETKTITFSASCDYAVN